MIGPHAFRVRPGGSLNGRLRVPGDKSISHRAIMLGAIADGVTEVDGFLEGADALGTLVALRRLGVYIEGPSEGRVVIHGAGIDGLRAPDGPLDLGNSGTSMRLLAGLLAAQSFSSELVGDPSLSRRGAAGAHGGPYRCQRGGHAATADPRRRVAAWHRLRLAGGERAGEVGPAPGGSLRRRPHLRARAGGDARSHRAHAGGLRLPGGTGRAPRVRRRRRSPQGAVRGRAGGYLVGRLLSRRGEHCAGIGPGARACGLQPDAHRRDRGAARHGRRHRGAGGAGVRW